MLLGDKPAFDIAATSCFRTPLFTSEIGQSPMWGLIQFLRVRSQSSIVPEATGFRLRFRKRSSQRSACCLNVTTPPFCCCTTSLKYSTVSAPLLATISRPRRSRSDLERSPDPESGHQRARMCFLSCCPGTSIHHLTTYHLPLLSIKPFCPVRRDMLLPLRFTGIAGTTLKRVLAECKSSPDPGCAIC